MALAVDGETEAWALPRIRVLDHKQKYNETASRHNVVLTTATLICCTICRASPNCPYHVLRVFLDVEICKCKDIPYTV